MSMEELTAVKQYMGRDDINFDVVLPNLSNIDSKLSGDTADVQFKKLIASMYEHYKKTKGPDGKPLLQKGERGFAQIIEDANKIGSVDIMLQLLEREPGKRLFSDAELLAARRTVLSFEIMAQKQLKKWEKTGSQVDLASSTTSAKY